MSIELILGPMFSGKTTELFRRIKRFTAAHEECLVIRYQRDTRYSADYASTHDREMLRASGASALSEVMEQCLKYDVIGIDEGQFYEDLVECVRTLAAAGKTVVISALDGDFRRRPFGRVLELVPEAESVVKLTAVCAMCHRDAPFTRRLTSDTQQQLIGGSDKYIACCRACFEVPYDPDSPHTPDPKEAQRRISELIASPQRVNVE